MYEEMVKQAREEIIESFEKEALFRSNNDVYGDIQNVERRLVGSYTYSPSKPFEGKDRQNRINAAIDWYNNNSPDAHIGASGRIKGLTNRPGTVIKKHPTAALLATTAAAASAAGGAYLWNRYKKKSKDSSTNSQYNAALGQAYEDIMAPPNTGV